MVSNLGTLFTATNTAYENTEEIQHIILYNINLVQAEMWQASLT
jgi:hypothetical protein